MSEQVIGGHEGLRVSRNDGGIVKTVHTETEQAKAWYGMNMKGIHNEARFLRMLEGCGYTPRLLAAGDNWIREEDVGVAEPPTVIQPVMRHCCRMLNVFREKRIRHIDLTWPNVIVRGNHPWAVDWQQSRLYDEEPNPQERWGTDSATVWRWMCVIKDSRGVADESRIVRRWCAVLGALGAVETRISPLVGKSFLDLGCFQGDHVAMARCEGMEAEGVDFGGFRSGEDSIEIAGGLWEGMGCTFTKADIGELPPDYYQRDVVVMFSTWPYLVQTYGEQRARLLLSVIVASAGALFFETQLYGDGPGPESLKNDEDVQEMLHMVGAQDVRPLATIPVYGRPASRTVWGVRREGLS